MKDPLQQLLESAGMKFAGEPEQKVADQVRGTETATSNGEQHPFHDRLVGEASTLEDVLMKKYQAMKEKDEKETEEPAQQAAKEQGVAEGMGSSSPTRVMRKYLPKGMWDPILSHSGKSKHDNADGSKTSHVWRLRNLVRSWRGREFDAWKQAVEQELGSDYQVTSKWPTPSVRHIQMNDISAQQGVAEEMPPVAPAGSPAATGAAPAPTTPVTLSGPEAAAAETAALEKIKTNAGLKGQFDALAKRAQVTPTTTGTDPIETATIEKIKANSGLKNQYNKLMQMAQQQPGAKV